MFKKITNDQHLNQEAPIFCAKKAYLKKACLIKAYPEKACPNNAHSEKAYSNITNNNIANRSFAKTVQWAGVSFMAISLAGCPDDGTDPPTFASNPPPNLQPASITTSDGTTTTPATPFTLPEANTRIVFNPAAGVAPSSVTDIIFISPESSDGTAATTVTDAVVTPAVNNLDGFSTIGQIDFKFDGPLLDSSLCTLYDLSLIQAGQPATRTERSTTCATLQQPNVVLLPLTLAEGADVLDVTQITGVDTAKLAQLKYRADVISLDCESGDASCANQTLRITPLSPLPSATKFLVAFTNTILDDIDVDGDADTENENASQPVGPSSAYHSLGEEINVITDLDSLHDLILGFEQIVLGTYAQSNFTLTSDDIIYTQSFTTTAPTSALTSVAAPTSFNPQLAALTDLLPTPKARPVTFYKSTLLGPGQPAPFGSSSDGGSFEGASVIVEGAIKLPYYLEAPAADAAEQDLTDIAAGGSASRGTAIVTSQWVPDETLGAALDTALGQPAGTTPPADVNDIDETKNLTYRYPFPAAQGEEVVPITVMHPNLAAIRAAAQAEGNAAATAFFNTLDESNPQWPTIVFSVGITTDRSINLVTANLLASACLNPDAPVGTQCFATVTIDHPVHGIAAEGARVPGILTNVDTNTIEGLDANFSALRERHFGYTANQERLPTPMIYNPEAFGLEDPVGSSGSLSINLSNFANTRDKLSQSILDHLNLLATLNSIGIVDNSGASTVTHGLNTDQLYFIGHSLGGVVGVPLVAINNSEMVQTNNTNLPLIKAAAFLNTSGGIGKLLENLPDSGFGASVTLAGLALASFENGEYALRQGTSNLESFFYFFQNTLDSTDPINYAAQLSSSDIAILATEVIGSADQTDLRDQTMPAAADATVYTFGGDYADSGITLPYLNPLAGACPVPDAIAPGDCPESESLGEFSGAPALPAIRALPAPLVGTEALMAQLGLSDATLGTNSSETGLKVAVRFTDGEHGTPVSPLNPVTEELHTEEFSEFISQLISFFSSEGQSMVVGAAAADAIYIAPAE